MTYIIAEIGINHNGDMGLAQRLIETAANAGCNAVKFQKRDIELVYTPDELNTPRDSPWGTTNREQKYGLEFSIEQLHWLKQCAYSLGLDFGVSAWDLNSLEAIEKLKPTFHKIASPMLSCTTLLKKTASYGRHTYVSTGMSNMSEIVEAVNIFNEVNCPITLMHTCSQYPSDNVNINLKRMCKLYDTFGHPVGYSGHERGLQPSIAAVALGATAIERHITLDRTMYGSDQASSLEPGGLKRLVRDIHVIEESLGTDEVKILDVEKPIRAKLANPYWKHN